LLLLLRTEELSDDDDEVERSGEESGELVESDRFLIGDPLSIDDLI